MTIQSARSAIIQFSENATQELVMLTQEMRLKSLIESIGPGSTIPEDLKGDIRQLLTLLVDLFGTDLPSIDPDPMETLRLASRDINLSRVLRERGLFRVFQLVTSTVNTASGQTIPAYRMQINPVTGEFFASQEEFLGWFCKEAQVARSLVFMRMAAINRLQSLGIPLEEVYQIVLSRPYAMGEVVKEVADWDKGEMLGIKPEVAPRLAERLAPDKVVEVQALTNVLQDEDASLEEKAQAREVLAETLRPALRDLVRQVAGHQNTKDAMDWVRHDVAGKPEIRYFYDPEHNWFKAEVVIKALDPNGTEYIKEIKEVCLIPDPYMPEELRRDLVQRLPIRNRESLDA